MSELAKELAIYHRESAARLNADTSATYKSQVDAHNKTANLIEQQQARISECERLHRELATSLRHDAESPSLCDLVAVARAVANERDELAATVDRLNKEANALYDLAQDAGVCSEHLRVNFASGHPTPRQNLNAVKRSAYEHGYKDGYNLLLSASNGIAMHNYIGFAEKEAAKRYPDKE